MTTGPWGGGAIECPACGCSTMTATKATAVARWACVGCGKVYDIATPDDIRAELLERAEAMEELLGYARGMRRWIHYIGIGTPTCPVSPEVAKRLNAIDDVCFEGEPEEAALFCAAHDEPFAERSGYGMWQSAYMPPEAPKNEDVDP